MKRVHRMWTSEVTVNDSSKLESHNLGFRVKGSGFKGFRVATSMQGLAA